MATRRKKARRGKGEGGLYQLADGTHVAVVELVPRRDPQSGKLRRRRKVFKALTQAAAIEKRDEWLRRNPGRAHAVHTPEKLTVATHLDRWLAEVAKPKVADNTLRSYRGAARHVQERIGTLPLSRLSASVLQSLFAEMHEDGVGGRVRQIVHVVLNQALGNAVKLGFIPHNFAADVDKPAHEREDIEFWDADEVHKILDAVRAGMAEVENDGKPTPWARTLQRLGAIYELDFDSGAREGEVFGLHWPEVDLKAGRVRIVQQLLETQDESKPKGERLVLKLGPPKTEKGKRWIELAPETVAALKEHRQRMMDAGHDVITGPVFVDDDGGFLRKSNFLRRVHDPLVARAGVKRCTFHACRHTSATLLLAMGIPPHVVSERLGHESVKTTLSIYAHVLPRQQTGAAKAMSEILRGSR